MTTLKSIPKTYKSSSGSNLKPLSSTTFENQSFEEIYKRSYSHGLEAIYTLENVDIKSVKRIETVQKTSSKKALKPVPKLPLQAELDFGDEFRGWIEPFVLKEPIQILGLTKHAEKVLNEQGISNLKQLIEVNLKDFIFVRGFGQGHIEEVSSKLSEYLEGKSIHRSSKVDFVSWLKSIFAAQDRKKVYVYLESYELQDLFSLSPIESVEVRKLTLEKKQEWIEELLGKVCSGPSKQMVLQDMQKVINTFIKPWMKRRGGFATKSQLQERFQRIADHPPTALSILKVLQNLYFDKKDFLNTFIQEIDEEVFCCNLSFSMLYEKLLDKTFSYFYKSTIRYELQELIALLEREFAKSWVGFDEGFIEKILSMSSSFCINKNVRSQLEITKR